MTSRVLTAHVPTDLADKVDQAAARLEHAVADFRRLQAEAHSDA
jgi:hypothetical protein